jgi:hypothetical protein
MEEECLVTTLLLFTYIFMLLRFGLYVFKYPYTCSSDFRYMTASLVFTSLGFVALQRDGGRFDADDTVATSGAAGATSGVFGRIIRFLMNTAMAATLICSLIVYLNWEF